MFERLLQAIEGSGPSVTDWLSAIATVVTALVALVAIWYARGQLKEASRARQLAQQLDIERAQPYIVIYADDSAFGPTYTDIVIKNFGQTAARNVRLSVDPPPQRSTVEEGRNRVVRFPDVFPILAPGQEWRTFFDGSHRRFGKGLPSEHHAHIEFEGIGGKALSSDAVLDWDINETRIWPVTKTFDDLVKSVDDLTAEVTRRR